MRAHCAIIESMKTTEKSNNPTKLNKPNNNLTTGTILTLTAGIAWGLSGASGQYLMAHGFPVLALTNLRLIVAGGLLLVMSLLTDHKKLVCLIQDNKSFVRLGLFAIFGLLLNQYAYLQAIHLSNAGTATVLQYICPVLILIYACVKDRVAPTVSEVASIVLAIGGTFLIATHGEIGSLSVTPLGLFWGLFSAFTYVLYILLPIALIKQYGSLPVIGIGMFLSGILLVPFSGVAQMDVEWTPEILGALAGIVLIGTVIAYTMFLKGASMVGPVKSSLLAAIEPISAVFFAFLIMNEQFFTIDFIGMAMILAAVMLISLKDLIKERRKKEQGLLD